MSYVTKNYETAAELVIGGKLTIEEGATVTGLADAAKLVAATESDFGCLKAEAKGAGDTVTAKIGADGKLYVPTYPVVPVAAAQADSTAEELADLVTDFNGLLTKLRAAGLLATT